MGCQVLKKGQKLDCASYILLDNTMDPVSTGQRIITQIR